jgi:hypothetical protein
VIGEHIQAVIIIGPVPDKAQNRGDQSRGAGVGRHNPHQRTHFAAPVYAGRVFQFFGHTPEELIENQNEQPAAYADAEHGR